MKSLIQYEIPYEAVREAIVNAVTYAEKAGSGILDMRARCRKAGLRGVEFREDGGQFFQTLWRPKTDPSAQDNTQDTAQVGSEDKSLAANGLRELAVVLRLSAAQVTAQVTKMLRSATGGGSREQLQVAAGMKHREHFRKAYVELLMKAGWLERTIPDKPNSRLQKYRLTDKGRAWIADVGP